MPNPGLPRRRAQAFSRQSGLCCYCDLPMCPADTELSSFAQAHGVPLELCGLLRATTEHLTPRCCGGRHAAVNIAAACWQCNRERGRERDNALSAAQFRELVQLRLKSGGWHPQGLMRLVLSRTEEREAMLQRRFRRAERAGPMQRPSGSLVAGLPLALRGAGPMVAGSALAQEC